MSKKNYNISDIFQQMELDLIASMKRAFYFHKRETDKEGFEWEQWQLTKLRSLEQYRKKNREIIESYNSTIQETIDRELRDGFKKGEKRGFKLFDKIKSFFGLTPKEVKLPENIEQKQGVRELIAKTLGRPVKVPQEESFFKINENKIEALQKSVTKDIAKANATVLRKMDDVYRQTIFKSQMYMQSGAKTLNQAIDMATKDFLDKGINSITYSNGANVNIASYAEMCLRTSSNRATLLGEGKVRDEMGLHLVVVTAHANTCPKCEPWQGKILIDDVFSGGSKEDGNYPLLSEAISQGLLHPNCRHTITTYFPGITQIPTIPDGKEAIETYKQEQIQRKLERHIRHWKRVKEGSVSEEREQMAIDKVKYYQKQLRTHLSNNKELKRNYTREG